jgi:hypothetical protein
VSSAWRSFSQRHWIGEAEAAAARAAYRQYLVERLMPPRTFLDEALRVR